MKSPRKKIFQGASVRFDSHMRRIKRGKSVLQVMEEVNAEAAEVLIARDMLLQHIRSEEELIKDEEQADDLD